MVTSASMDRAHFSRPTSSTNRKNSLGQHCPSGQVVRMSCVTVEVEVERGCIVTREAAELPLIRGDGKRIINPTPVLMKGRAGRDISGLIASAGKKAAPEFPGRP